MKRSPYFFILLMLISYGCATTGSRYESRMNSFIGLPVETVLDKLGNPQKSYKLLNGDTILEYVSLRSVKEYVAPPYMNEYTGSEDYIPPDSYISTPDIYRRTLWCRTKFVVDPNGTVVTFTHEGNACWE